MAPEPHSILTLHDAARRIGLHPNTLLDLIRAGFISGNRDGVSEAALAKFQTRVSRESAVVNAGAGVLDGPDALSEALEARFEDMAHEVLRRFTAELPEVGRWPPDQRNVFLEQARGRFAAILSVADQTSDVDSSLRGDLENVGRSAATAGSSLPHLLLVLRLSRNVLLQAVMRLTTEQNANVVLSSSSASFVARLLTVIDSLGDALGDGYWAVKLETIDREVEDLSAFLDSLPLGLYEADMDGIVQYANKYAATLVGRSRAEITGIALSDLLKAADAYLSVGNLLSEPAIGQPLMKCAIEGPGGVPVDITIEVVVHRTDGVVVGFGGVIREGGVVVPDSSYIVRHVEELRRSIGIMVEAGAFLHARGSRMSPEQVAHAGDSFKRQSDRLLLIIDELDMERRAAGD